MKSFTIWLNRSDCEYKQAFLGLRKAIQGASTETLIIDGRDNKTRNWGEEPSTFFRVRRPRRLTFWMSKATELTFHILTHTHSRITPHSREENICYVEELQRFESTRGDLGHHISIAEV